MADAGVGEDADVAEDADPGASQLGGGILYVVATPIGNLGDITLRALEVLRAVPLVAAEHTRHSRRIWERHGIATRLVSYHAQSPPSRTEELIAHLTSGLDLAIVTDAGTPLVSDPGQGLVTAWAERGGRVVPIPGASAVLAALAASGIPAPRWSFEGFLPRTGAERRARLERIARDDRATVIFESPNRTGALLRDLAAACGPDRRVAVGRELTKLHEEIWRGTLAELTERAEGAPMRGEVTLVVSGEDRADARRRETDTGDEAEAARSLAEGREQVAALVRSGLSRSAAARSVARASGLARRDLFRGGEGE